MDTSEKAYTTFDIREKLKIKIDRQKDWLTRGFIEPSIQRASGQGTKNLFSHFDLYLIKLFECLLNRGYPRKHAAKIIEEIRNIRKIAKEYENYSKQDESKARSVAHIKEAWDQLKNSEYLIFPWNEMGKMKETKRPTIYFHSNSEEILQVDMKQFKMDDEIRIINFKKIKDQVDSAIA